MDPRTDATYAVVGSAELARLWRAIIDEQDLGYVDCVATAGLSIDADNYADVLRELLVLRKALALSLIHI